MSIRLLPLLLLGCIERPADSGTLTASDYTGWQRYQLGSGPDALNCDLQWNVTGTPAQILCPECVFAFDLSFAIDDSSSNDGTCQDPDTFSQTYVLIDESGQYSVGTWSSGKISVFAEAEFDDLTGQFSYTTGNSGFAYSAYYYTQYTSGYGLIQ